MSIVAQTPSHRDESADVFVHDAATLSLRSSRSFYVLYILTTTKALPRRLEFLGIGASVTLLLLVHLKFSEPRNVEYNEVFLLICDVHEF